jgi:hypothetical protein
LAVNFTMTQTVDLLANGGQPAGKQFFLQGDALIQQSSSNYLSTLGAVQVTGDYNGNFAVDAADYTKWRDTLGQSGTGLPADGDGSGTVDQADYDLWKAHFGALGHAAGVPSPTVTTYKVEFLDAGNNVLQTNTIDLRADTGVSEVDAWKTHTLSIPSVPANSAKARVTASALNMVQGCTDGVDCTGGHDVYMDNLSLVQSGFSTQGGGQKLSNGGLNMPGAPAGFTITNSVTDNFQFSNADFANYDIAQMKGVAGEHGIWLRAFQGGDFSMSQTVPGVVGDQYTFSVWSKWELNYRGADSLSTTHDKLQIEFLNSGGTDIGSPVTLDMRTVQMNDNTWRQISMSAVTAPAGTVQVKVSEITTGMVAEQGPSLSAMLDNFSLIQTGSGSAVPEPSSILLMAGTAVGMLVVARRRR